MKKLLTFILLTSISLCSWAQKEVFRIDSIPSKGILLDKGWKWHAGDNPDFAKPDFDDSKWENIDPNTDIYNIPQKVYNQSVSWLRIHLEFDSSLVNKLIVFQINQNIASEIYYNGNLIKTYGKISNNFDKIIAFRAFCEAIEYQCNTNKLVISIRFSIEKKLPYVNNPPILKCFSLVVNTPIHAPKFAVFSKRYEKITALEAGIFFILALLHFRFYMIYKKQKANIYISVAVVAICLGQIISTNFLYESGFLKPIAYLTFMTFILRNSIYITFAYVAVYTIHTNKFKPSFWFITIYTSLSSIFILFFHKIGVIFTLIFPLLFITVEILKLTNRIKGKIILSVGLITSSILYLIYLIMVFNQFKGIQITENFYLLDLLFHLSVLIFPIAISIYLSNEYAGTSLKLENRLVELRKLSQEKQEALQKQNAELQAALLQGQTIERKRVAADLHDSLGSTMSSLIYTVNAIDIQKLDDDEKNVYQNLKQMLDTAYNEIRLLSHNLLPEEFEKQGLAEALKHFVRKINQSHSIRPLNRPKIGTATTQN
ncbi:sensor histidine kinase [Runella sp. SP2]|uniref:sensor histidine kinase n=1 Tax=Runella sp. SP2 TaxID=2268026 RepID=UPI0013DDB57B|nr:histidine kinase [Runella sp. SP2]